MNKYQAAPAEESPDNNRVIPRSHRRRRLGARREAAKHETREALVAAAMASFAEEGLDNPSLDAICARAGYTRGAFYVHFKDREDLVAAVSERFLSNLLDVVGEGSEGDSLDTLIMKLVRAVQNAGPVPAHQFLLACGRSEAMRERYIDALGRISTRFNEAARKSGRTAKQAETLAWTVIALATGVQSLLEVQAPFDADAVGKQFVKLLAE